MLNLDHFVCALRLKPQCLSFAPIMFSPVQYGTIRVIGLVLEPFLTFYLNQMGCNNDRFFITILFTLG